MSAPKLPIFSGAADEKACIAIMGKLSFTNQCLKTLHEQTNKSINALAALIVEQPDNIELHHLLLKTHAIFKRSKCVAKYDAPGEKMGPHVICPHSHEMDIHDNGDWEVSITEKGKVRIHLTKEAKHRVLEEIKRIPKSKNWVVY
jgi:hypothetical protein